MPPYNKGQTFGCAECNKNQTLISATPQDMSLQVSKKGGRLASDYAVGSQGQSSWKILNF